MTHMRGWAPFGYINLVRLPEKVSDDQAMLASDIFPTGYFGADLAEVSYGDIVAVFGCGPVGLFTIANAGLTGAGRVLAVDRLPSRLDMEHAQGAEDPVETIRELTAVSAWTVSSMLWESTPSIATLSNREQKHSSRK